MKIEVGKEYRTRSGDVGVITHWFGANTICYRGYVRYADVGMSDLMGVEWGGSSGRALNYEPRYDLVEEIRTPDPTPSSLGEKPTNPKDAIATNKLPLHLWPETASAYGAMGFLDGALKYGRTNWRHAGVRASIYYDAARRHLNAWFEGEDIDPQSGVPHLGHALACIAILVDAKEAGKLNDDRAYPGGYAGLPQRFESLVASLRERHADKNPQHYTIMEAPVMSAASAEAAGALVQRVMAMQTQMPLSCMQPNESLNDYYERLRNELESKK